MTDIIKDCLEIVIVTSFLTALTLWLLVSAPIV
jgi:hypothetical protein